MEQIIEMLTPWAKPVMVFCGFMLVRYIYRTVILRFLMLLNCIFWGIFNISDITHGFALRLLTRADIHIEESLANILSTMMRILLAVIATLMVAKEWNYDMSGLLASLSIGSLALAFAAKDALANVFGSFVIILDKPFKVGDWISANGVEGTVEKISFRSTCIRTFPQELVYVPNSLLSNTPIINYTKREKRRLEFLLGVTYDTTHDQMQKLVADIRTPRTTRCRSLWLISAATCKAATWYTTTT